MLCTSQSHALICWLCKLFVKCISIKDEGHALDQRRGNFSKFLVRNHRSLYWNDTWPNVADSLRSSKGAVQSKIKMTYFSGVYSSRLFLCELPSFGHICCSDVWPLLNIWTLTCQPAKRKDMLAQNKTSSSGTQPEYSVSSLFVAAVLLTQSRNLCLCVSVFVSYSFILGSYDKDDGPQLYMVDPSGISYVSLSVLTSVHSLSTSRT